jgi:hypothetical protein
VKPPEITFQPLQEKDFDSMRRWLNTPHVSQWWNLDGNHHPSPEEVAAKYTPRITAQENVNCYIINYDSNP